MTHKIVLTPELQQQILASIRAGGYAHVSAQAWGVPQKLWDRWLRAGRRRDAREPYRTLERLVQQARAQARLRAEMTAMEKDARFWLKNGPAKDAREAPGWATGRAARGGEAAADPFVSAEFLEFLGRVRMLLLPHPDVLAALNVEVEFRPASRTRRPL